MTTITFQIGRNLHEIYHHTLYIEEIELNQHNFNKDKVKIVHQGYKFSKKKIKQKKFKDNTLD
jgi:hypothetical protein